MHIRRYKCVPWETSGIFLRRMLTIIADMPPNMPPKRKAAAIAAMTESDGDESGSSDGFVPRDSESEEFDLEAELGVKKAKPKGKTAKKKAAKKDGEEGEKKKPVAKRKRAKEKVPEEGEEPRVRPPEFNSYYVPVPFKGRIGYVRPLPSRSLLRS